MLFRSWHAFQRAASRVRVCRRPPPRIRAVLFGPVWIRWGGGGENIGSSPLSSSSSLIGGWPNHAIRGAWVTAVGGEGKGFAFPLFGEGRDLVGSGGGGFLGIMVVARREAVGHGRHDGHGFMGFVAGLANELPHVILGTYLTPQGLYSA